MGGTFPRMLPAQSGQTKKQPTIAITHNRSPGKSGAPGEPTEAAVTVAGFVRVPGASKGHSAPDGPEGPDRGANQSLSSGALHELGRRAMSELSTGGTQGAICRARVGRYPMGFGIIDRLRRGVGLGASALYPAVFLQCRPEDVQAGPASLAA